MLIDPATQGQVGIQEQQQNLQAGCFQAVDSGGGLMEADPNAARDGVGDQGVDRFAVGGVDGESHRFRWLVELREL